MPVTNLNRQHFSDEKKTQTDVLLDQLEELLKDNAVNLNPEDRQRYGSVNEQNKLFINKVNDYYDSQPQLSSPDVDWEEFKRDYESRKFLERVAARLQSIGIGINNSKTLHDWDNYQDALADYRYVQYKFSTAATEYEKKLNDLKQFFNRSSTSNNSTEPPTPPEAS